MVMSMPKLAVVAAMEREVWPFVKDWPTCSKDYDGRTFKFFEKEGMVVVCGGMGAEAARRAAEAVIALYQPGLVISAGFAGALDPALQVGHTLNPRYVIDAGDGSRCTPESEVWNCVWWTRGRYGSCGRSPCSRSPRSEVSGL